MADNQELKKNRSSEFYTKIIIYRKRQMALMAMVLLFIAIFTIMIHQDLMEKRHWFLIGTPLCLLGSCFLFFPPTEQWHYSHWQNEPEKQEQYFYN